MKKLIYMALLASIFYSCKKDCSNDSSNTYNYYKFDETKKLTFPYHFKDSQLWVNLNMNDTLIFILKDTISSYDTTNTTREGDCPFYNVDYNEKFSYYFRCLEDSSLNYNHIFYRDGFITKNFLKFNNIEFAEYGSKLLNIDNIGVIYRNTYVSKYFAENDSLGLLRITVNNIKLYRIK